MAPFNFHKWCLKYPEFSNILSSHIKQSDYEFTVTDTQKKPLGIIWNLLSDKFSISLPKSLYESTATKRTTLSTIAQLFEPLCLIGPVIVIPKIINSFGRQGVIGEVNYLVTSRWIGTNLFLIYSIFQCLKKIIAPLKPSHCRVGN